MNLKLKSIADKGNLERERLVIRVLNDTDVGDFLVLRTGYSDGTVTARVHNTFWFPDKKVTAGDLVVLYTKRGTSNEKQLEENRKAHFFYWGRAEAQWADKDRAVVLLETESWDAAGADDL